MKRVRYIFLIVLWCYSQTGYAQQEANINTEIDKSKILIGEPLKLTIAVSYPEKNTFVFAFPDSIPHFEILEKPIVDTIHENGLISLKSIYRLTSFDSGHWVIPSFKLTREISSDTIPVDIVFSDFDPSQDYHDIKDILDVKPVSKKKWLWYIIAGLLVAALLAYYFLRTRKIVPSSKENVVVNPYEEAMKKLEQLRQVSAPAKTVHSKLTDIFRMYIFRKKGIHSLQKTTDDIVLQLKGQGLKQEQFEKLSQALRLSDFVNMNQRAMVCL